MSSSGLTVTPGLAANKVRGIPSTWDPEWFRRFITSHLKNADYRNAVAGPGISITATQGEQQPGEISATGGGTGPVTFSASTTAPTVTIDGSSQTADPTALLVTQGTGADFAARIQGSTTMGSSYGLIVEAGTNSADYGLFVTNAADSADLFIVRGDGAVSLGGTFEATGPSLYIGAPTTGNALWVDGVAGAYVARFVGVTTTGESDGVLILAGTNSVDVALAVTNAAETLDYFLVRGDGALLAQGIGTGTGTELVWTTADLIVRSSSSIRYKDDVQTLTDAEADKVLKLRPITYITKPSGDQYPGGDRQYGLIAEEVVEILPDLVARNKDGSCESVHYRHLTALLLNQIQRLRADVDKIKSGEKT